jgi:hypothetical protein
MTPDTADCSSLNGRSAFETNARPKRSHSLSKCWGDRPHPLGSGFGFDRFGTQSSSGLLARGDRPPQKSPR